MENIFENIDLSELTVLPEEHEFRAAKFFAKRGKRIKFIKPSNIPSIHTPDFQMDGVDWEVKSPKGDSKRTIENNFRKAMLQSSNIIFDLRRCSLDEKQAINQLKRTFDDKKQIRKLLIITKNAELIELKR